MVTAEEAAAAAALGMPLFLAIGLIVVGFCLGFLVGARARQIHLKMMAIPRAVISLLSLFRISSEKAAGLDGAETQEGEEDEEEEARRKEEEQEDFIDKFLDADAAEGLDDHPDLSLSPVIMYNIKKNRDAQRLEKIRQTLLAEGLTADEVEERLQIMLEGGGRAPGVKDNPLAVLIAAGARVEGTGGRSEEQIRSQELKRLQRNVAVYLAKTMDVDTKWKSVQEAKGGGARGGRAQTALDKARETKKTPIGGNVRKLEVGRMAIAKASRDVWRDFQRREGKNLDERMPTLTEDVVPGLIEKVEEDVQPAEEEDEEDEEESDSEGEEENFKI